MALEIERKFLVCGTDWKSRLPGIAYTQGYLCRASSDNYTTVRLRIAGDRAFITIKGLAAGFTRSEFEYSVPPDDAHAMLSELCAGTIIEKTRYQIVHAGSVWEIDEFHGSNAGLVLAEIELDSEQQPFEQPHWLGREVSADPRFRNSSLAVRPFNKDWLLSEP